MGKVVRVNVEDEAMQRRRVGRVRAVRREDHIRHTLASSTSSPYGQSVRTVCSAPTVSPLSTTDKS